MNFWISLRWCNQTVLKLKGYLWCSNGPHMLLENKIIFKSIFQICILNSFYVLKDWLGINSMREVYTSDTPALHMNLYRVRMIAIFSKKVPVFYP